VTVAVLAAGQGKRMVSDLPKPLHLVAGTPIVERVIRAGLAIEPQRLAAVVNPDVLDLPERLGLSGRFETILQAYPYGTAGALRSALDHLPPSRWVVSLLGDSPLLTGETVQQLIDGARQGGTKISILTCLLDDAGPYGRIDRDTQGNVQGIVELKADDPAKRLGAAEINSGIMVLDASWARGALERLEPNPISGELYLTDILDVALAEHVEGEPWPIATVVADRDVALGINDREQLAEAEAVIHRSTRTRLMKAGVTLIAPETIVIDETVEIGPDTTILPFSVITGATTIGGKCQIGPHAVLHNATIADGVELRSSTVTDSSVGPGTWVGPYAHLRGNTRVGPNVHVGTAAEMKNTVVGDGSHVAHFSYLGDATIGAQTNIGAGTISANYDGTHKHPTVIGDNVFIGSDSVLIAPVTVADGARTGAGSVVNRSVAAGVTVVGVPARPIATRRRPQTEE
jgi:bifunctional UDP-N-acetylglucosamine pyrophosphorylase/glucosamine-1-phosphate N-acetyltransferase